MNLKNKNNLIIILGLMAFLTNGDTYAASALLSTMASDLGLEISQAALSVTAYMLSFGIFTLIFGPLSDRYGKAKIINIAAIGTSIFSILGAFSFNLPILAFFRAINGLFGAGILPVTMSLIGDNFDGSARQKALGKVMGLAFLGSATSTAIGGAIAYFGSWRLVYIVYGTLELLLGFAMLKLLPKDEPKIKKLNIFTFYKEAVTNFNLMSIVTILFFVGFAVLGSFSFAGILITKVTGFNTLIVGLILSVFGVGTVIGGKVAVPLRKKFGRSFLFMAGIVGSLSYILLATSTNLILLIISLLGIGISFISIQSTLVVTSQERLPHMKGTAMSLASFFMFVGAGVGTTFNGTINVNQIFINTSIIFLIVGVLAAIFVNKKIK